MSEQTNWQLIARYLCGEYSEEDRKEIYEWLNSDPTNQELLEQTEKIWNALEVKSHDWDVMAARLRLVEQADIPLKTNKSNHNKNRMPLSTARKLPSRHNRFVSHFFRVAAILFVGMALTYFFKNILLSRHQGKQAKELTELVVEHGKQSTITLGDGSKILLDAGSVFRYPDKFTKEKREVFLQGEGFFEVSPNVQKPFIVHTNNALIRVLGTKFNVRAWPLNRNIKVAVLDGKVSFRSTTASDKQAVIIPKGKLSFLRENDAPSVPRQVDIANHLAWRNHEMIFEDVPLYEVLAQLERWYNLQFNFTDKKLASLLLTTHIRNEPISDILKSIALVTQLKYEYRGNTVVFSPKFLK